LKKLLLIFLTALGFSAPAQVVIIRHSDKWDLPNTGFALDPTGYSRAVNFAFYYLGKFGVPDALFATNPIDAAGNFHSMRELQTLGPLSNLLTKQENRNVTIMHPFDSSDYNQLAAQINQNPTYANKTVLVCWNHTNIPALAKSLGVSAKIPVWSSRDFDTVYVLGYKNGRINKFEILSNQYPTNNVDSWKDIQDVLSKI
jgi:hypothetical protein